MNVSVKYSIRAALTVALVLLAATLQTGCGDETNTNTGESKPAVPEVTEVWARATMPKAETGAIYMTISSATGDRLIKAGVPSDVARRAELHETAAEGDMKMDDGKMMMHQVDYVELPKGKEVMLKPGGLHVMLFDLKKQINTGDSINLSLEFEKAGKLNVAAEVKELKGM